MQRHGVSDLRHASSSFAALLRHVARDSSPVLVPAAAPRPRPGDRLLNGRFELLRQLGRGGMGVVYEAIDHELGDRVAIKTLRSLTPESVARLRSEFRAAQDLCHANLVQLREFFEWAGGWFFTMERVRGIDFLAWVRDRPERLAPALRQLVDALHHLHSHGRVHRDVKPNNILITDHGRLVLLDFGLAQDGDAPLWFDTDEAGTAAYMAPEQACGSRATEATDWYAVGTLIYEALTGSLPFGDDTAEVLICKRALHRPERLAGSVLDAPDAVLQLCDDLLAPLPTERAGYTALLAVLGGAHHERDAGARELFVGREKELTALCHVAEAAAANQVRRVLIVGESGVGKSALVRHFLRSRQAPTLVLSARCYERESVPYKAVEGIVDQGAAWTAAAPQDLRSHLYPQDAFLLARAFPLLARVPGWPSAPDAPLPIDAGERSKRLRAAFRDWLRRLAGYGQLLLVLDDAQWADAEGAALLASLGDAPAIPHGLVVCSREEVVTAHILGHTLYTLPLGPLPAAATRTLLGRMGVPEKHQGHVLRESRGHPMFAMELVRRGGLDAAVSGGLDALLREAAGRLQAERQALLECVCLAGAPLSRAAVATASGRRLSEAMPELQSLVVERWLTSGGPDTLHTVEPYHDRIREAVAASIDPARKRTHHAALARALAEHHPTRHDVRAHHLEGAGDRPAARAQLLLAADSAADMFAFERAAELCAAAIGLDDAAKPDALSTLGKFLGYASRPAEAGDAWLRAARAASGEQRWECRRNAAQQLLMGGQVSRGLAELFAVMEWDGLRPPRRLRQGIRAMALGRWWLRVRGMGRRWGRQPATPERLSRIDMLYNSGLAMMFVDGVRGADLAYRSIRMALDTTDPFRVARAFGVATCLEAMSGDLRRAERLHRRTRLLSERSGELHAAVWVHGSASTISFEHGRWRETIERSEWLDERMKTLHGRTWEVATNHLLAQLSRLHSGEIKALQANLRSAHEDAQRRGDALTTLFIRATVEPIAYLLDDDPKGAEASLTAIREALPERRAGFFHVLWYAHSIALRLFTGDVDGAVRFMDAPEHEGPRRVASVMHYGGVLSDYLRGCAWLAQTGEALPPHALAELQRTERRLSRSQRAWVRPYGTLLRAQRNLLGGRSAEGTRRLESAVERFAETDSHLMASVAQYGARNARPLSGAGGRFALAGVMNPRGLLRAFAPVLATDP